MAKRILVIMPDGDVATLDKMPSLREMQAIVGGYIEHVRVLDRFKAGGAPVFTSMFVNEEGLLRNLPRNEKATAVYQRNVRAAFPDAANPFRVATEQWLASLPAGAAVVGDLTPASARAAGYDDDPWICGTAILFDGWTIDEVNDCDAGTLVT